jgi:hypothetical protein
MLTSGFSVQYGLYLFPYHFETRSLPALIYVLACAVSVGAVARIYARLKYGNPGTAGPIPVVIEVLLPIFLVVLSYLDGKDATKATTRAGAS